MGSSADDVASTVRTVRHRFEGVAGRGGKLGRAVAYGCFEDNAAQEQASRTLEITTALQIARHRFDHRQALLQAGLTVKHGTNATERLGAILADLMMHAIDHPGTALLILTDQRCVLDAAVQLGVRTRAEC